MSKVTTVVIGKVVGVHGTGGELKVLLYASAEDCSEFFESACKTFYIGGGLYTLQGLRPHKRVLLVKLKGVATRNEALAFVGQEVSIDKGLVPPLKDGEYYWFDLVDMEVRGEDDRYLGRVASILSTGSNDVLEVRGPYGEVLIPAIKDVFLEVDVTGKRLKVRLLEGLLDEKGDGEKGKGERKG